MEKLMLWRSADVPHVEILGSIHVLDGPIPQWVVEAQDRADVVMFESNMLPQFYEAPPEVDEQAALSSTEPTLWRQVSTTALCLGATADEVEELRRQLPFIVGSKLGNWATRDKGIDFEHGVEKSLQHRAEDRNEEFYTLESYSSIYDLLSRPDTFSEQVDGLRSVLKRIETLGTNLVDGVGAWRRGDLEGIIAALVDPHLEQPALKRALFTDRHSMWLPRLEHFISGSAKAGHRLLIVIGCHHLTGPLSLLLDLERRNGFRFQQVEEG